MPFTLSLLLHIHDILGFLTTRLEEGPDQDEVERMMEAVMELRRRLSRRVQGGQELAG